MKKFEYETEAEYFGDYFSEDEYLKERGNNGWELVSVEDNKYYWKRALPESNDKTETK